LRRDRRQPGDVIGGAEAPPGWASSSSHIVWMSGEPLATGAPATYTGGHSDALATIRAAEVQAGRGYPRALAAEQLELNEIGVCSWSSTADRIRPLRREAGTWRFVLIDRLTTDAGGECSTSDCDGPRERPAAAAHHRQGGPRQAEGPAAMPAVADRGPVGGPASRRCADVVAQRLQNHAAHVCPGRRQRCASAQQGPGSVTLTASQKHAGASPRSRS